MSMFALDHLVETFHDGLSKLSIDWLNGSEWENNPYMGQITRLSIWGLVHTDFDNVHMSLWRFFESHYGEMPVHLGVHMTDHISHGALFKFVRQLLIKDIVFLRSLDISVECDNQGVMSIHPRAKYWPPIKWGVINQLIRRTKKLYTVNTKAAEIMLHKYGGQNRSVMYAEFPEFERIYEVYNILHNNDRAAKTHGILEALMTYKNEEEERDLDEDVPRFKALHARGFDLDFKNDDIMRLETVSFSVYF